VENKGCPLDENVYLMEWPGRAPAPPAIEAGKGRQRQGARYVSPISTTQSP
jgi:hypothetical protein